MKRRKDCYFGLHFDFHANKESKNIGQNFSKEILSRIIEEVKPDFIQCDTKGHPGYCDYPSKIGTPAPGLTKDLIKEWKDVCSKYDVPLFSHYSGMFDMKVCQDHPEWARVDERGNKNEWFLSPFSPYADEILIPMLDELASNYGINGAWIDGECWATLADFSPKAKGLYKKQTGKEFDEHDLKPYLSFCRDGFKDYVKHYCNLIKNKHPDFDITSNWMNTAWLPDDIAYTDFISGDLSPTNSVDSARFDGRVMAMFSRPWDIMSWGISFPIHYMKSALTLKQEASIILSLGGGFQLYNMQDPVNTVMDEWGIPMWAEVSSFVKKHEGICHHGKAIEDVGFLYSVSSYYDCLDTTFSRDCPYNFDLYGNLINVLDCGKSVSLIHEDKEIDYSKYSLICVSNSTCLKENTISKLLEYASNGGKLLLLGPATFQFFKSALNLDGVFKTNENDIVSRIISPSYALEVRKPYVSISLNGFNDVIKLETGNVGGDLKLTNPPPSITFIDEEKIAFGSIKYKKGIIGIVPIELGKTYLDDRTFELNSFMKNVLDCMGETKVQSSSRGEFDVYFARKNGKDYVHVCNLLGEHRALNVKTFDYIPPVLDAKISLISDKEIKSIRNVFDNEKINFDKNGNRYNIVIPKLDLYDIYELEY